MQESLTLKLMQDFRWITSETLILFIAIPKFTFIEGNNIFEGHEFVGAIYNTWIIFSHFTSMCDKSPIKLSRHVLDNIFNHGAP